MTFAVPIEFLAYGRLPDRDVFRTLALRGPMTTKELRSHLRIARDATFNAACRLERARLVHSRTECGGRPNRVVRWYAGPDPKLVAA